MELSGGTDIVSQAGTMDESINHVFRELAMTFGGRNRVLKPSTAYAKNLTNGCNFSIANRFCFQCDVALFTEFNFASFTVILRFGLFRVCPEPERNRRDQLSA